MRPWVVSVLGVGWVLGVLLGSVWVAPVALVTALLIGSALVYAGSWEPSRIGWGPRVRLAALAVLAGALGTWHANEALLSDQNRRAQWEPFYGQRLSVRGVVREAEVRGAFTRLTVGLVTDGERVLPGFLRATVPRLPGVGEGAEVLLRGTFQGPKDVRRSLGAEGVRADLDRVFSRRQVFATLSFPAVHVEREARPSFLTAVRLTFRDILLRHLPDPAAGLYSALLLSFDHDLAPDFREHAATAGILHLVAISGTHLALIAAFVFFAGLLAGFSRPAATAVTLVFLAGFLALVGFPESGVRSGIMAGFVLAATVLGRRAAGLRALLLAVVVMTAVNPRILLGDVGFQLSALAVWGLLTIFPLLQHWFRHVPDPFRLRSLVLLTVAAEIATAPVVAYAFGRIPLIGPLTNLAAGALFPVLLALGATLLALGLLAPAVATLLAPIAAVAGNVFLGVAELGSRIPGHVVSLPPFSLTTFLFLLSGFLTCVHLLALPAPRSPKGEVGPTPEVAA